MKFLSRSALTILATLAFALGTSAQEPTPNEATLRTRADAIEKVYVDKSVDLVHWAFTRNLYREAAVVSRVVLEQFPEHEVGQLLSQIEAIPQDVFLTKYRDAARANGTAFQSKRSSLASSTADSLVAIAREADKAMLESLAESLYLEACNIQSNNGPANSALRRRDYDVIFNCGPIPKSEKEETRRTLQNLGGGFLSERELKTELGFWSDAWGMSTRHYRLVTNVKPAKAFRFVRDCEDLYEAWGQLMKGLGLPVREWKDRCSVYLFDSGLTYQVVLHVANVDPPKLAEALGFYWGDTKVGYFYDDPTAYRGDVGLLAETLYHEGGHQLFDLRFKIAVRDDTAKFPCPWLDEGLATYLETLEVEGAGGRRVGRFGTVLEDDVAGVVDAEAAGKMLSLKQFVVTSDEEVEKLGAEGTAHAAAFVHFLLHGSGGAYRKAFSRIVDAVQKTGGVNVSLHEMLGMKSTEELETKFHAHVRDVLAKLPRRKYKG